MVATAASDAQRSAGFEVAIGQFIFNGPAEIAGTYKLSRKLGFTIEIE
jgi:hypothetical protein